MEQVQLIKYYIFYYKSKSIYRGDKIVGIE